MECSRTGVLQQSGRLYQRKLSITSLHSRGGIDRGRRSPGSGRFARYDAPYRAKSRDCSHAEADKDLNKKV